ncbi:MAG: type II toxin-antitoxin system RelE/ParE family toxin [Candidatus Hydrogenedentes bacterium]|nr:type II toxin-antitoxin system RelE/ParE family toxin [Candidatus Hydrogenedentota bacterium]
MKIRLHPQARAELLNSMNYYEAARPGLGDRFLSAVAKVVDNARMFPTSFPIFDDDCRKAGLRRFPCSVVYRIRDGEMQVVSVLHSRRDPESIRNRW